MTRVRRVLAVWRHRNDTIAGYARYGGRLLPHLLAAAREPKEPPSAGRRDRAHADPAPPTVLLPALLDPHPQHGPASVVPHEGAQDDDATTEFFAGLRADDTASLDPVEMAWEHAFRTLQATIDAEVRRGRRVMDAALERLAPGWVQAICDRTGCGLCVHDFSEAMEAAGVIALPAVAVDYSTGEYAVVST